MTPLNALTHEELLSYAQSLEGQRTELENALLMRLENLLDHVLDNLHDLNTEQED